MKTSKMFITIVTALAMASCNNDKEFANQPELEMQVPEGILRYFLHLFLVQWNGWLQSVFPKYGGY